MLNLIGTTTGRLASSSSNVQGIPQRCPLEARLFETLAKASIGDRPLHREDVDLLVRDAVLALRRSPLPRDWSVRFSVRTTISPEELSAHLGATVTGPTGTWKLSWPMAYLVPEMIPVVEVMDP